MLASGCSMAWQPTNRYSITSTSKKSFFFIQTSRGPPNPGAMRQWREAGHSPLPSSEFKVSGTNILHFPICIHGAIRDNLFPLNVWIGLHTLRWQRNIQTSQESQPISRIRPFDVQVGLLRHYLWFATVQMAWTVKPEEIIWNSKWRVRSYFVDL